MTRTVKQETKITRMDMVNISKGQQLQRDEKCQLNATDESSMNEYKTLILQNKLQLATVKKLPIYPSNIKENCLFVCWGLTPKQQYFSYIQAMKMKGVIK